MIVTFQRNFFTADLRSSMAQLCFLATLDFPSTPSSMCQNHISSILVPLTSDCFCQCCSKLSIPFLGSFGGKFYLPKVITSQPEQLNQPLHSQKPRTIKSIPQAISVQYVTWLIIHMKYIGRSKFQCESYAFNLTC